MRAEDLTPEIKNMRIQVEVTEEPKMVLIGARKAKIVSLPSYGEAKVITHHGEIKRYRLEEGEEF